MKSKMDTRWMGKLFYIITARKYTTFISVLILVTVIFSSIGLFIHRSIQNLLIEELRYSAENTAVTAASFIEADIAPYEELTRVERYEKGSFDEAYYEKMQNILRDIRKETNIGFIYTMKQVSEDTMMYLLDGEEPSSEHFSPIGEVEKLDAYQKEALSGNGPSSSKMVHWEGWGKFISGNAPIRGEDGQILGLVGVDIGTSTVEALMRRADRIILTVAFLIILIITVSTYKIIEDLSTAYNVDYLTKLYSRRHHDRQLEVHVRRAKKRGSALSIMMIDVDNFKNINDFHGHETGDQMLRYVAEVIRRNLRKTDISSRIGGDEFNIILPGTSLEDTKKVATRILSELEENEEGLKISVSIGAAKWEDTMDSSLLTKTADEAMYKAKESGRNQVQVIQKC